MEESLSKIGRIDARDHLPELAKLRNLIRGGPFVHTPSRNGTARRLDLSGNWITVHPLPVRLASKSVDRGSRPQTSFFPPATRRR